jgi:hypothetical protein
MSEKTTAAASYIITFYREVLTLTHYSAVYNNLLLEIESKYDAVDVGKMTEPEKKVYIENLQQARYSIYKTYVQFKTLQAHLKVDKGQELNIDNLYSILTTAFIIKRTDLMDYTVEMNRILLNDIIQNILETSQEFLSSLYAENKTVEQQ